MISTIDSIDLLSVYHRPGTVVCATESNSESESWLASVLLEFTDTEQTSKLNNCKQCLSDTKKIKQHIR